MKSNNTNRLMGTFLLLLGSFFLLACSDDTPPAPCNPILPEQRVFVGEVQSFLPCFTADALPLTYHAESSDSTVARVEEASTSSFIGIAGESVGAVVITVEATDANGLTSSAPQILRVSVPNRPPRIVGPPFDLHLSLWTGARVLLSDYVDDPDREVLEYTLISDDPAGLRTEISGDTLVATALKRSKAEVVLRATDQGDETIELEGEIEVGDPLAYITQAASSRRSEVTLIANREGFIRVFLESESFGTAMPSATATLYHRDGKPLQSIPLESDAANVPREINEGDLGLSLNAFVDSTLLGANVSKLVIDIEETTDPLMPRRIDMPLEVTELPDLVWTLIPVVMGGDTRAIDVVRDMATRPRSSFASLTLAALPISGYQFSGHDPIVLPDVANPMGWLLNAVSTIRQMEGNRGYYMAITPGAIGSVGGQAYLGGRDGWSMAHPLVIAHELGHNLSLLHAPCGGAGGTDTSFPHHNGTTGVWGFDFRSREVLRPDRFDLMGYCFEPEWISDYHFTKSLRFRTTQRSTSSARYRDVLVVSGLIDPTGTPSLEPAFYAEAPPTPISGASHQITGRDAAGGTLFTYRFTPPVIMDGPGGSAFVHMIPVTWGNADLNSITLDGPGGTAVLDPDRDEPLTIIMRNGQVRAIVHESVPTPVVGPDDRVIFTRGIPTRR